tara:strand:+ start:543 stop:791 length:249 start_codon:yes stop_codon:yes gene_type:complete
VVVELVDKVDQVDQVVEDFILQVVVTQVMQVDLQFQKEIVEALLLVLLQLMVEEVVVAQLLLDQLVLQVLAELEVQAHQIQF